MALLVFRVNVARFAGCQLHQCVVEKSYHAIIYGQQAR
jgi:hypothetical protein